MKHLFCYLVDINGRDGEEVTKITSCTAAPFSLPLFVASTLFLFVRPSFFAILFLRARTHEGRNDSK